MSSFVSSLVPTLFCLFLFLHSSWALPYSKNSGVIELTKDNFASQVFSSEHVWLVEFYAPWCGHCQRLAPEWEKAAKNLKGLVRVAAVNCDEHQEIAGQFGIRGFPTIKLFGSQLTKTNDGKGVYKSPEDYQGPRTAASIAKFALSKLPSFVDTVTESNINSFLSSQPELPKVLLFTEKKTTTSLYKALSVDFHHSLKLGQVRNTESSVVEKYGVEKFPKLIVITLEGEKVEYEGKLSHEELFKFLSKYAVRPQGKQSTNEEKTTPPPSKTVRPVREELTKQETFEEYCFDSSINCVITLLDPVNNEEETHEQYLKTLESVQEKNKDFFHFFWIDGTKQQDFVDVFHLYSGFPTTIIFNHKKMSAVTYLGVFEEEPLTEFLKQVLRGKKRAARIDKVPKLQENNLKEEL